MMTASAAAHAQRLAPYPAFLKVTASMLSMRTNALTAALVRALVPLTPLRRKCK